jgi:hypothetical protein
MGWPVRLLHTHQLLHLLQTAHAAAAAVVAAAAAAEAR